MKFLISVTTYKKNAALIPFVQSILDTGMHEGNTLLICDDDNGGAREVFDQFKDKLDLVYVTGKNQGIARNKNRGIRYFIENKEFDRLILADDDITLYAPGILEDFEAARAAEGSDHINSYLPDSGYFKAFPVISMASSELICYCQGVQGIFGYYTRELIEKLGYYFPNWPYHYGFEHSEYSARALKLEGNCPELFPSLWNSDLYIKAQQIPNNYEVDLKKVFGKQSELYHTRLQKIYSGVELSVRQHGLGQENYTRSHEEPTRSRARTTSP